MGHDENSWLLVVQTCGIHKFQPVLQRPVQLIKLMLFHAAAASAELFFSAAYGVELTE